ESEKDLSRGRISVALDLGIVTAKDLAVRPRIYEFPKKSGRGLVIKVHCKNVVRTCLDDRVTVSVSQSPHVSPGVLYQRLRGKLLLESLDHLLSQGQRGPLAYYLSLHQNLARCLVANTETKG